MRMVSDMCWALSILGLFAAGFIVAELFMRGR